MWTSEQGFPYNSVLYVFPILCFLTVENLDGAVIEDLETAVQRVGTFSTQAKFLQWIILIFMLASKN